MKTITLEQVFKFLLPIGGGLIVYLINQSWVISVSVCLTLLAIIHGYTYLNHQIKKEETVKLLQTNMMAAFSWIKVLIIQGMSPYQAFQTILPYVQNVLADKLHQLTLEMDQDSSLQPFLHFSENFHSIMIEQLVFSLYQLGHQGGKPSSLSHFQYLFDQADQQHHQAQMAIFNDQMQSANGFVMIATGLIAFSLLLGVMQLIGGMIYGN
jgi:hypothetical protein